MLETTQTPVAPIPAPPAYVETPAAPPLPSERDLLYALLEETRQQKDLAEKRLFWIRLGFLLLSGLLAVLFLLFFALTLRLNTTLAEVDLVIQDLFVITESLTHTLQQVEQIDLIALSEDLRSLTVLAGEGITEALASIKTALGTLQQVDIQSLNDAISDLQAIVSPLATLFGR